MLRCFTVMCISPCTNSVPVQLVEQVHPGNLPSGMAWTAARTALLVISTHAWQLEVNVTQTLGIGTFASISLPACCAKKKKKN